MTWSLMVGQRMTLQSPLVHVISLHAPSHRLQKARGRGAPLCMQQPPREGDSRAPSLIPAEGVDGWSQQVCMCARVCVRAVCVFDA